MIVVSRTNLGFRSYSQSQLKNVQKFIPLRKTRKKSRLEFIFFLIWPWVTSKGDVRPWNRDFLRDKRKNFFD